MSDWKPLALERVERGFHLYVARAVNNLRWRWSVTEIVQTHRPHPKWARASGYAGTCASAIRMADKALKAILAEKKK